MKKCLVLSDYEEKDRFPLVLFQGDEVCPGPADQQSNEWVWVKDRNDRQGYVPKSILQPIGESRCIVLEDFDSTVLRVQKDNELVLLRSLDGWCWCKNQEGKEGWLPNYLLKIL